MPRWRLPTMEAHNTDNSGFYSLGKIICMDLSEPARADSDRCRHAGRNNHDGRSTKPKLEARLGNLNLKAEAKRRSGGLQWSERRRTNIVAEGRRNRAGAGGCCGCCVDLTFATITNEIREAAPRLRLVGAFPPRKHTTVAFTP
jgi:hypothetical protein